MGTNRPTFRNMAEVSAYMDKIRGKNPSDRTETEQTDLMEWDSFEPSGMSPLEVEDYLLDVTDDQEVDILGYLYKKHYSRTMGQVLWARKLMELERDKRALSEQLVAARTMAERAKTAGLMEYFNALPPAEQEELRETAGRARNDEELRGLRAKNRKLERELEAMSSALSKATLRTPSPFDVKWANLGGMGTLWNRIKGKAGIIIFAYLAASVGYCMVVTFWG